MVIKLIHWNATSVVNKKDLLSQYLYNNKISVAAVQETFLKPEKSFFIKDYETIRKDRQGHGGGVCLLIHKAIKFQEIPIFSQNPNIEVIGCKLFLNKYKLSIINFYIPPNAKYNKADLQSIFNLVNTNNPDKLFICGDFNSHHQEFGSGKTDLKGKELLEFINFNNLVYLNDGSPTFFHPSGSSVLDISITSPSLSLTANWLSSKELLNSGHSVIITTIDDLKPSVSHNSRIVPSIIEEDVLNKKFDEFFSSNSINADLSINEKIDSLNTFFNDAFSKTVKPGKPITTNLWWTPECSRQQAKQRLALTRFNKFPNKPNFNRLQAFKIKYSKTVSNAKSNGWKKFCAGIDPTITCGELWRIVKSFKGNSYTKVLSEAPWLDQFCNNLRGPMGPSLIKYPSEFSNDSHQLTKAISLQEAIYSLSGSKKRSSPGLDNIRYTHLLNLNEKNLSNITSLFNECLQSCHIPSGWNTFEVVPICKKGVDPNLASSRRPIAKGSCLRKWFEGIIKIRLEWYLEGRDELDSCQSGFRRGKSTTDNILALWSEVQVAFHSGSFVPSIFLDIKGAFDNVNIDILFSLLSELNIPEQLSCLIYNLFSNKTIIVKTDNANREFTSFKGLSQGTILAPLLFNIYINHIFKNLDQDIKALAYADDICLYTSDSNVINGLKRLQKAVDIVTAELTLLQLSLSPSKCKTLIFSKRRLPTMLTPIQIDGNNTEFVEKFCFLGFYFDTKMNYSAHINFIKNKCNQFMNVLRALCGVSWGAHPSSLLQIYKGAMRPKMDYASPFFQEAASSKLIKLDRVQWRACRISLGAMISTHTLALEVQANIPPLSIRRKFLTNCMISKTVAYNKNPSLNSLSELNTYLNDSYILKAYKNCLNIGLQTFQIHPFFTLNNLDSLFIRPNIEFLPLTKKDSSDEDVLDAFNETLDSLDGFEHIYTDGSKKKTGTSSAFWIPHLEVEASFRCSHQSTIFSAEAIAIREALLFIKDLDIPSKYVIISDSMSCLRALLNKKKSDTNFIILQIANILHGIENRGIDVRFLWVPSHKGIQGNNKADELATSRVDMEGIDFDKTLVTDIRSIFKSDIFPQWQAMWDNSVHGRDLYNLSPLVGKPPWFNLIENSRHFITIFNRLRFNHCCALAHLKKVNITQSDLCDCGSIQTVDHLLFSCNLISFLERSRFLKKMYLNKVFFLNIKNILKNHDLKIFELIYDFIKKVEIRI